MKTQTQTPRAEVDAVESADGKNVVKSSPCTVFELVLLFYYVSNTNEYSFSLPSTLPFSQKVEESPNTEVSEGYHTFLNFFHVFGYVHLLNA